LRVPNGDRRRLWTAVRITALGETPREKQALPFLRGGRARRGRRFSRAVQELPGATPLPSRAMVAGACVQPSVAGTTKGGRRLEGRILGGLVAWKATPPPSQAMVAGACVQPFVAGTTKGGRPVRRGRQPPYPETAEPRVPRAWAALRLPNGQTPTRGWRQPRHILKPRSSA
jgi:hypothetical protein